MRPFVSMHDSIPINSSMSTKAAAYMTRLPMTRQQYDDFVSRTQRMLDSSEVRSLHYLKEVSDGYRGDEQCFFVFSDVLRCEVGWNSKHGIYVAPVCGYTLFGRKNPTGYLTMQEWFDGIQALFHLSGRATPSRLTPPPFWMNVSHKTLCEGLMNMIMSF